MSKKSTAKRLHPEPRRIRPVEEFDVPRLDDLDELDLPPMHGKLYPPSEMDEATPTLDDSDRRYFHHPSDSGVTEFDNEPEAGDAARDLASELGREYLEGVTRVDDMSDIRYSDEEREESELPFVIEEEEEEFGALPPPSRLRKKA